MTEVTTVEIEAQIAAWIAARRAMDFAEADRIHVALEDRGLVLEVDAVAGGVTWARAR